MLIRTYLFSYLVFKLEDVFCGLKNCKALVGFAYSESDHEPDQQA